MKRWVWSRAGPFQSSFRRELRFLAASPWDRAMLGWIPLILLCIVSLLMADGVMRNLPVAVVDADGSAISRELSRRIDAAPGVAVVARPADMQAAEDLVRRNQAYAIVLIPEALSRTVAQGGSGEIVIYYNASYSTPSGAVLREATAAIRAYAAELSQTQTAFILGPQKVRAPPISARTTVLFNPQGSYELQLVGLLHPSMLHLIFMVAVVSALGRELRDGTIGEWLEGPPLADAARIAGKLAPYFAVFMIWAVMVTGYLAGLRGWPIAGSPMLILAGYAAMYLAYAGVAILFVGRTLSMAQSLSLTGIYAGASFAFAGAIFPLASASTFAQMWSALLPYTTFAKLWAEQYVMGVPAVASVGLLAAMSIFLLVGLALGMPPYLRAARRPDQWGKR